ncbi:MAG: stage 0 sporulation family protein [Ruminococcus sp.]|nr:stage 0 sporulation family protein [Ruminococcus sp.]
MKEIVGIRFKSVGKIYYFSPGSIQAEIGDMAIVETVRGVECGEVVIANRSISDKEISSPLKPIIRIATENDLKIVEKNKLKEKEAFKICEEKIAFRKLKMKLIDVECTFDNNKLLFYFTAENRVDFRELVKDIAAVFRTRIELRQIGVRDEAKILGGLSICGREFCCKGYMGEFQPVSIKMAKEQGLSLNPTKISGTCGRLMCCLKNEQNAYEELLKITPKVGALVVTPNGEKGKVEEANLITGKLRIKTEKSEVLITLDLSEVKLLRDAEIKVNRDEIKALKWLEDK